LFFLFVLPPSCSMSNDHVVTFLPLYQGILAASILLLQD
jgi:hypothetical protein